jgi:Response regulator containing CheY-like receiver domain and AraC-type DNA-binding domain
MWRVLSYTQYALPTHPDGDYQGIPWGPPVTSIFVAFDGCLWHPSNTPPRNSHASVTATADHPSVLIVDDEATVLKYIRLHFERDNYRVYTATSAAEAATILEEMHGEVDAILTDQKMPEETGLELLERIRHRFPKPARILTSAFAEHDVVQQALNAGIAERFVPKPWNYAEVSALIQETISEHASRGTQPALPGEVESVAELARYVSEGLCPVGALFDMLVDPATGEVSEDFVRELADHVKDLMITMREIGGAALPPASHSQRIPVDFVAALVRAKQRAKLFLSQYQLNLETEVAPGMHLGQADPRQIDTFFRLLLASAMLFSPAGSTIQVRLAPEVVDGESLAINVDLNHELALMTVKNSVFFDTKEMQLPRLGLFLRACMRIVRDHGGTVFTEQQGKPPGWLRFSFPVGA